MIEFKDKEHQDRFVRALVQLRFEQLGRVPQDWAASLYILTANEDLWERFAKHIDFNRRLVDFNRIRHHVSMGHGWSCMLSLAHNLFNGDGECSLSELIGCVDHNNFTLALEAIQVSYYGSNYLRMTA